MRLGVHGLDIGRAERPGAFLPIFVVARFLQHTHTHTHTTACSLLSPSQRGFPLSFVAPQSLRRPCRRGASALASLAAGLHTTFCDQHRRFLAGGSPAPCTSFAPAVETGDQGAG